MNIDITNLEHVIAKMKDNADLIDSWGILN